MGSSWIHLEGVSEVKGAYNLLAKWKQQSALNKETINNKTFV